jgi:hypothetical protein
MTPLLPLVMAATLVPVVDAYRSARDAPSGLKVLEPTPDRLLQVQQLFAEVARSLAPGPPPEALVTRARQAGFELRSASDVAGELWILREPDGSRQGAGFYALRAAGLPVCIQAPHTFFDEGTGELALAAFAGVPAACLCVNTVHRRVVDVAHAERSQFRAATEGLLSARSWTLVQLHGFAAGSVPPGTAAIVSEGVRKPSGLGARLRRALKGASGEVLLFPTDIDKLGATTNVEGASARAANARFLHIEMSPDLRRHLVSDPSLLVAALREVLAWP